MKAINYLLFTCYLFIILLISGVLLANHFVINSRSELYSYCKVDTETLAAKSPFQPSEGQKDKAVVLGSLEQLSLDINTEALQEKGLQIETLEETFLQVAFIRDDLGQERDPSYSWMSETHSCLIIVINTSYDERIQEEMEYYEKRKAYWMFRSVDEGLGELFAYTEKISHFSTDGELSPYDSLLLEKGTFRGLHEVQLFLSNLRDEPYNSWVGIYNADFVPEKVSAYIERNFTKVDEAFKGKLQQKTDRRQPWQTDERVELPMIDRDRESVIMEMSGQNIEGRNIHALPEDSITNIRILLFQLPVGTIISINNPTDPRLLDYTGVHDLARYMVRIEQGQSPGVKMIRIWNTAGVWGCTPDMNFIAPVAALSSSENIVQAMLDLGHKGSIQVGQRTIFPYFAAREGRLLSIEEQSAGDKIWETTVVSIEVQMPVMDGVRFSL